MSEINKAKLREVIENGYDFHLGGYVEDGFSIFGKKGGEFVGFTFLFGIVYIVVMFIPLIGPLAVSLCATALMAGYYIVADKVFHDRPMDFGNFFDGFKYIVNFMLLALVSSLLYVLVFAPLAIAAIFVAATNINHIAGIDAELILGFGFFFSFIPIIYLSVSWMFAPMFIVFYKMGFWEAMETSRKLITKRWWSFFSLMMALGVINIGGGIVIVGLLATIPATMCALYVAFADITRFAESVNEEDYIMEHLID